MIFTDFFKKRGKKKNKYGMIPQNFNRRTNVAMEHNGGICVVAFCALVRVLASHYANTLLNAVVSLCVL